VDSSGNVYLAGTTYSPSFPVLNPIQPCSIINGTTPYAANFLAEFSPAGGLLFSTCLGTIGSDSFALVALTLDSLGNAYVAGNAAVGVPLQSPIDANPPLESGGQPGGRPFISEIDHSTHALLFSSFVGEQISFDGDGTGDQILALAVDSSGNIYLAGESGGGYLESPFPVFNAIQPYLPVYGGCPGLHNGFDCFFVDGFIIKISPDAGAAAATSPGGLYLFGSDGLVELVGSTSPAQVVTVYDLGTDPLTVSNVATSGNFAIQSNNCSTVSPAGGSCAIGVTFTPTQVGTLTGTLTIADNSASSPHTVQLFGVGGQLSMVPSPSTVSFASQLIGTSTAQNVTLTNPSAFNVQITRIQVSGSDFTEANSCQSLMLPSYVCTVDVTFTPTATGTRTGTLTITDNAPNSPQTVSLTGIGAAPGLGLGIASGGSNSATVAAGATATYALTIGGMGMSGTVSLSCAGAPAGSTCTVPATETITATATTPFKVTVTTTSGSKAALLPVRLVPPRWLWAFALMGLVLLPATKGARRSVRLGLLWLPLSLVILLCSCGGSSNSGGGNSGGTPTGTYTLTVTGTMGSTSQPISLTLIVQ
jgi:hypothetical protein